MAGTKHATLTTKPNNPAYDVSADAWNEAHSPGACAEVLTDHNKLTHDGLGIDAATLEGSTKATVQDHNPKSHDKTFHTSPSLPVDEVITDAQHGTKTSIPDAHHSSIAAIEYDIDGGGSVITVGMKGGLEIPFACTILGWTIFECSDTPITSSIVVDVWKKPYTTYPPTVSDSITGSEKPTLSNVIKNQDLTLTTWTTSVSAGDILFFNVDSVTSAKKVVVSLKVQKS